MVDRYKPDIVPSNVTPLPRKVENPPPAEVKEPDKFYLTCSKCNVMSFNVVAHSHDDPLYEPETVHQIYCAGCEEEVTSYSTPDGFFNWARSLPNVEPDTLKTLQGVTNTVATGSVEVARRRVVRQVEQWSRGDTLALIVAFDTNAASKSWMSIESEAQRQWIMRRLEELGTTVMNWKTERQPGEPIDGGIKT